jgi:hypothetical protein
MVVLDGVTAIDTSVAGVTVNVSELLVTPPEAAVIVVEPSARVVARPDPSIVATPIAVEFHVAVLVRFAVLESV